MYSHIKVLLVEKAKTKVLFMDKSINKYLLAAITAGVYVGLAYFFAVAAGSAFQQAVEGPFYKIAVGMFFPIALYSIMFAGAELFTGNNMLLFTGWLDKQVSIKSMVKLWTACYVGNFVGSVLVSIAFYFSNSADQLTQEFFINLTQTKINYTATQMFIKGVFCNFLVCLAVLCAYIMKSEAAKMIMIFVCITAFVTSGFEHSIANMSLFSTAWLYDQGATLDMSLYIKNISIVTLGNIVGGALLGGIYFILGSE